MESMGNRPMESTFLMSISTWHGFTIYSNISISYMDDDTSRHTKMYVWMYPWMYIQTRNVRQKMAKLKSEGFSSAQILYRTVSAIHRQARKSIEMIFRYRLMVYIYTSRCNFQEYKPIV